MSSNFVKNVNKRERNWRASGHRKTFALTGGFPPLIQIWRNLLKPIVHREGSHSFSLPVRGPILQSEETCWSKYLFHDRTFVRTILVVLLVFPVASPGSLRSGSRLHPGSSLYRDIIQFRYSTKIWPIVMMTFRYNFSTTLLPTSSKTL